MTAANKKKDPAKGNGPSAEKKRSYFEAGATHRRWGLFLWYLFLVTVGSNKLSNADNTLYIILGAMAVAVLFLYICWPKDKQ